MLFLRPDLVGAGHRLGGGRGARDARDCTGGERSGAEALGGLPGLDAGINSSLVHDRQVDRRQSDWLPKLRR
jgi:hypothetical protein